MDSSNYASSPAAQPTQISVEVVEDQKESLLPQTQNKIINRLKHIYKKSLLVLSLNKLETEEQRSEFLDSDLIGPALLCLIFALILLMKAYHGFLVFNFIIAVIQLGAMIVAYNAMKVGGQITITQGMSILGYCMIPINFGSFLIYCIPCLQVPVQIGIMMYSVFRASQAAIMFFTVISPPEKQGLVLYPVVLYYTYVGYLVLKMRYLCNIIIIIFKYSRYQNQTELK